jgi:hypothetical protein
METTKIAKVEPVDMKLEVVLLGVSDVDRAKRARSETRSMTGLPASTGPVRRGSRAPEHIIG